jgi:hypothetical protein
MQPPTPSRKAVGLGAAPDRRSYSQGSAEEQLLVRIANGLKTHAALRAYKGVD